MTQSHIPQGRFHRATPAQVRHIARTMLKTAEFQGTVFDYAVLLFELATRLENAQAEALKPIQEPAQ
jgi:hypothetical protein